MTVFRNFEKALAVRNQNANNDSDWQYVINAVSVYKNTRQAWIIEVRDEDGVLLGCL